MKGSNKLTLAHFWRQSMHYKGVCWFIAVGVFATMMFDVAEPLLVKYMFDILSGDDPDKLSKALNIVFYMLALSLTGQITWRAVGYAVNILEPRVMSDLLNKCYDYLMGHSYGFYVDNFVGSIVTRVRRFHGAYERVADSVIWELSRMILRTIAILGVLLVIVPLFFGATVLVWCVLFMGSVFLFSRYKLHYDKHLAEQDTTTTGHLADTLTNVLNIKLFTGAVYEIKMFHAITEELFERRKKSWDVGNHANVVQGISMVILSFLINYNGVTAWSDGSITLGTLILLRSYTGQIFDQMWDFGRNLRVIYESLADSNEMTMMLEEKHEVVDRSNASTIAVKDGLIEFRDVSFHYQQDSSIFEHFSLAIHPGQRVALVGPSGGGKTTITKLLFRFKDLQEGQILIDGQDISQVTQDSLRQAISLVPQDPNLFHRSLMENIRYGRPDATEGEVVSAAKAAHAHEFICKFADGYNTLVGERGVKLSGGQRQRVAIARAFLKNSPILVLDEATSSLDSESESLIHDALFNLVKGKTVIVIAHRLSTIMNLNPIIVLADGQIKERGSHNDLIKMGGIYRRLWDIQAGGFIPSNGH